MRFAGIYGRPVFMRAGGDLQTSGAGYEVVSVETSEQALSKTAGSGNTLLTIILKTSDQYLDDAQGSFMPVDGEPCYVTDGGSSIPAPRLRLSRTAPTCRPYCC